ncbi:hypothetical protein BCR42DRAFT_442770 [Absidia repens]|uniref:Uncharacterized protein n=1 Tax=Absidia repens TaxID=90262 RepID=A0A1X2I1T1_9FUNG|nr:hypothetical protein BCR42DRAFT_442770 [Absidia repens]
MIWKTWKSVIAKIQRSPCSYVQELPTRIPLTIIVTKSESVLNEATEQENVVPRLKTITQLVKFLNLVYLPYNPNSEMYEEKSVTINNVLSKVWNHSDLFADKEPYIIQQMVLNEKYQVLWQQRQDAERKPADRKAKWKEKA